MSTSHTSIAEQQRPVWNRGAARYADLFDGQVTQTIEPMLDGARVARGTKLLDIATGPGILVPAAIGRGASVTGVDFAEDMIAVARQKHPGADFHVADAAKLPFDDESFDAVTIGLALFLIEEPEKALSEAWRVLRSGGRIAISLWDWPVPGFSLFYDVMPKYLPEQAGGDDPPLLGVSDRDLLSRLLADAGFGDVGVDPLPIVWEIPSANRLFDALASLRDLSSLSNDEISRFRSEVVEGAREYEHAGLYRIPFPALVVTGVKAGSTE